MRFTRTTLAAAVLTIGLVGGVTAALSINQQQEVPMNNTNSQSKITINGQNVQPDANGSVHRVTETANSRSQIDVQVSNEQNNTSSSSVNVEVTSSSSN